MLPSVQIAKADFQTGSASPSPVGVLAIIAASDEGTANAASSFARDDLLQTSMGDGPLTQYGSYAIQVGGNSIVAVKGAGSTAGAYGTFTKNVSGTCVPSTSGTPNDEYHGAINIIAGGTVGTPGITYQYSGDDESFSGTQALGSATSITIPGTGIVFALAAGTLLDGDNWDVFTTRPLQTDPDVTAALEALRITRLPWELVLIDCTLGTDTVGLVDTWLEGLEAVGQFHGALLNYRHKNVPVPGTETEAAYATAITAATAAQASIRVCVGADAADLVSTMTGWSQPRPTSLFLAARAMKIPIGEDPAYVGRGPLAGASISDGNGNPRWHDEDLYQGLDAQRLVTLRSYAPGGPQGVYITDANILSPNGSDYVWLQHMRVMNVACGIAWQVLTGLLSIGVGKKPADPVTGLVYIQEKDAQRIEGLVNAAIAQPLKGQVNQVLFKLSRTDNLSSNTSSTVTGTLQIVGLEYIKQFRITTSFATSIPV